MRRTPRMTPPEPKPEPVFTCGRCETDVGFEACDEELVDLPNGAELLELHCPDCGDVLADRTITEPEGV